MTVINHFSYNYLYPRTGCLESSLLQTLKGTFLNLTLKEEIDVLKDIENNQDFLVKNGLILNKKLVDPKYLEVIENDKRENKEWNSRPENNIK